jgi:GNAT superfamily N-acetyltransferase
MIYTVRDFEIKDQHACWDISVDLWGEGIANKIQDEMFDVFEFPSGWPPFYCVAECDKKIVGFAGYRRALIMADAWEFSWNNVHKDHQREGIGRILVDYRINKIKEFGGTMIMTMTPYPDLPGKRGFEVVHDFGNGWFLMINKLGPVGFDHDKN